MKPNKEQVLAMIRHVLTFAGGLLVANGYLDAEGIAYEISGSVTSLVGLVWSLFDKKTPTI